MRESDVEKYLVQKVKDLGGECRKVQWVGRSGAPDRVVTYAGYTVFVEVKAPGQKPKSHQLREHNKMRCMGQHVIVVDNVEDVDLFLKEILCHS